MGANDTTPRKLTAADVPANTRRGGDLRVLLSPATVGATSGFFGQLTLRRGEYVSEHYHPYSEEFLYVVTGRLTLRVDDTDVALEAGESVMVPIGARHRLDNRGADPAFVVFALSPLAPSPELGHVNTEPLPEEVLR